MWLPVDIAHLPIAEEGCELKANELFSPDSESISDAVVGLGSEGHPFRFFCSAEFISPQGLLMTNYHCGTRMIQRHSKVGANFFEEGYWAQSLSEELENPGLTASILVGMVDVTDSVLQALSDSVSEANRKQIVDSVTDHLVDGATLKNGEEATVKAYYEGNRYYLLTYKTYPDVRLVGVPSKFIGKFGGETDNWEWPRHTGDFCVLRVYADSLGNPATYDSSNVPLKPKHYLPISKNGVDTGDFSFIMGFPGSTDRYLPSAEIELLTQVSYAERVKVREAKLEVLDKYMSADEDTYIKYYVKNQSIANYYKNFKGQIQAVEYHNVVEKKARAEKELQRYIDSTGTSDFSIAQFDSLYAQTKGFKFADAYYKEGLFYASSAFYVAYKFEKLRDVLKNSADSANLIRVQVEQTRKIAEEYYANYSLAVDKALFNVGLELTYQALEQAFRPDYFAVLDKKYKGDVEKFSDYVYSKSIFRTKEHVEQFLAKPSYAILNRDPLFAFAMSSITKLRSMRKDLALINDSLAQMKHLFVADMIAMQEADSALHYPDANSTLRFTYGTVGGYIPRDAVYYKFGTTAQGIVEKYYTGEKDYFVPDEYLKILKDTASLPVCFISDNDITGGNSGSPVMNRNGELIGVAFDGNWEAMSGDILFDENYQRCINADARYILFVIERFGKCQHILDELTIR